MRTAVRAGADAVYFGLQGFNARARATNFEEDALESTLGYLHEHGVKGYVTLNTLVFGAELARMEAAIRRCAAAGVDAVIVQDLGVARMVKAIAPDLPIHASTQMTCTDAGSVLLAESLGATRVILARELSLEDIAAIRGKTSMELEVFVHGALCIAYSGQCLTSEAIGGRSANRGACAQACRLPYELLVDGEEHDLGDKAYLLSPQDLEASAEVGELVKLGIASLKIEGRLKGPEYVAATTRLYRSAIDAALGEAAPVDRAMRDRALQMYTRGSGAGFFRGVDHQRLVEGRACDHRGLRAGDVLRTEGKPGKERLVVKLSADLQRGDGVLVEGGWGGEGEIGGRVWTLASGGRDVERAVEGDEVALWLGPEARLGDAQSLEGRRVWRTDAPAEEKAVQRELEAAPARVRMDLVVEGEIGELPRFSATAGGRRARIEGDTAILRGEKQRTTVDVLRDKLGKLGETPFTLGTVDSRLPDDALLPLPSLNRARRALADALTAGAARSWPTTATTHADLLAAAVPPDRAPPPEGLFVLCRTLEQAKAAALAGADGVYLDFLELTGTGEAVRELRAFASASASPVHITLAPPRIRKPGEEKIDRYLASLAPDAMLVRGLGALHEGGPAGVPRVGDFSLNVANRIAAREVLDRGCIAFTPSFDLDAEQLEDLLGAGWGPYAEVVVHHPMPLFHMEHCVIAATLSEGRDHRECGRPCDKHKLSLRDRAGAVHPLEADVACRNTVFHGSAQSAAGSVATLQARGVRRYRLELVRETAADVAALVGMYRQLLAGRTTAHELRRLLKTERGYGVVRGSLRVL
jgi:putative protease